jgi:hypothetical protein
MLTSNMNKEKNKLKKGKKDEKIRNKEILLKINLQTEI